MLMPKPRGRMYLDYQYNGKYLLVEGARSAQDNMLILHGYGCVDDFGNFTLVRKC